MLKINEKVLNKVTDLVIDTNENYFEFGLLSNEYLACWKELNVYLSALKDLDVIDEDVELDLTVLQYKELKHNEIKLKVTEMLINIPNKAIDDFDLIEQF